MPDSYSRILIVLAGVIVVLLVAVLILIIGDDEGNVGTAADTTAGAPASSGPPPEQSLPGTTTTASLPTTTTTTELPPPAATTAAPTTTSIPTTTTTVPIPLPAIGELARLTPPDPTPGSDGASGNGCAPGDGPLPDGYWFGYVMARDASGMDFDLACLFFGQEAQNAAADDGTTAAGDIYVRNENPTLRRVEVTPGTEVWRVAALNLNTNDFQFMDYADWPAGRSFPFMPCPGGDCGVWIFVSEGRAGAVVEQFFP